MFVYAIQWRVAQNLQKMKTIKISELKVSDKLPNTEPSQYGQYINRSINSIRITKNGRFVITVNETYVYNGVEKIIIADRYSNGALSGESIIKIN
jgi:hypothetical protein